jgi:hypothetical protein
MSVKRYTANKDNTISSAFKLNLSSRATAANMGSSDILEMYSIFAQASSSSVEQSRILLDFPLATISSQRDSGILPASGSTTFKVRMFNAEHNQTTPEKITVEARVITRAWSEGTGMDMESFLDTGASSWTSASTGAAWYTAGGDFLSSDYIASSPVAMSYNQYLDVGTEDIDIDVTPIVEEYIKNIKGQGTSATGSIVFNTTNPPSLGQSFKIYTYEGDYKTFQFANTTGSSGKVIFVLTGSSASGSSGNLINAINTNLGTYIAATGQDNDLTASLSQRAATFYGNTIISSSAAANVATITNFVGGTGAINHGLLIKLSGSSEDGSQSRSYYTKKFFSRSSHHQMERPVIEVQWDSATKDDRSDIIRSSSLAPAADNLNNIYLYNRIRNKLVDIPSTGSLLVTRLLASTTTGAPVAVTGPTADSTFITASKSSTGIYKAQFAYSGTETTLYDVWQVTSSGGLTTLYTGSAISVSDQKPNSSYEIPSYFTKITNLKSAYAANEHATFRIYTRSRNWQPNIYTVASSKAPVTVMRDGYYKICRVTDDMTVIDYSTGSIPSYSSLSYDSSGSYFDLDMSILEPNYLYEIRLLYKDETDYIEQKEKFKFRVDP